jgi:hypothetical protein
MGLLLSTGALLVPVNRGWSMTARQIANIAAL